MADAATRKTAARHPRRGAQSRPTKPQSPRARSEAPAAIRNFRSAINFLSTQTNYETMVRVGYNPSNFNLTRMLRVLAALGNPHRKLRCLHIAGTKGKGSTAHMTAAMLRAVGYRTGLYTSPHVTDIRERIAVDGQWVSEPEFARLIARVHAAMGELNKDQPTFFEIITAAGFLHFVNQKVDLAVIETGLGGRLDSTNVIRPEVCAITSISYDHMAQLGSTLEAIAEEKAGIFKPGVPVISAPQTPGVKRVLRDHARKVGCDLRVLGEDLEFSYRFECSRATGPNMRVCLATKSSRFDHVRVPLLGEHQAYNCGVALGMLDALRGKDFAIPEQQAVDGLAAVRIPGRLELIRDNPRTVVDAAHNAASVAAVMRAIGQNITYDSMVVIFGCAQDKDIDGMLQQLELGADKVIFTSLGTARSADPRELMTRFAERSQKMAQVEPNLLSAFRTACHCVGRDDLICITGSFQLVGQAKQHIVNAVVN